jgi:HK97 gp10 family phage protein
VDALDQAMQDAMQRSSIFADVDAVGGTGRHRLVLGADAPYALFVELGTSRMRAQPFLRPAIDKIAPKLTERLRAAVRSVR